MDWMIATENPNSEAPVFPKDEPALKAEMVWGLYANGAGKPGPRWGEWGMWAHGLGLTYDQAVQLAQRLGFEGAPIGGDAPATL